MNRYNRTPLINGGNAYGTSYAIPVIRENIANGNIRIIDRVVLQEKQTLYHLAGQYYGNSRDWWILAAASGIGWMFQCPPGTIVLIPNLQDVSKYVG
jgi:hypothetical protein